MAKKFVRSITGIKNIQDQDLSTNNVGDLLSDGKDIYVHRKTAKGDEYFNLTSGNGGGSTTEKPLNLVALEGSGIEIWKNGDNTNIQLSAEFLKNNAQWLEGVNGIKVTNRQDKYGKSFTLELDDNTKAKLAKIDELEEGGGTTTPVTIKNTDGNLTITDGSTINLASTVANKLNTPIPRVEVVNTNLQLDTTYDSNRNPTNYKISIPSRYTDYVLGKVDKASSYMKVTTFQGRRVFDLSDDTKAKIDKIDELTAGTIQNVENTDGNLTVAINNYKATINASDTMKDKLDTVESVETDVSKLKTRVTALETGAGGASTVLSSPKGTISLTPTETGYKLDVDNTHVLEHEGLKAGNGVAVTHNVDHTETTVALDETTTTTLAKVTTLESKVTELENNAGGNAFAPKYNSALINGIRYTLVALPYGSTGNYLATITLETVPIPSSSPVYLARTQQFNKYLSNMSFPSSGYLQSGCILMKQNNGQIEIHTANDSGAGKVHGQFTVILSSL